MSTAVIATGGKQYLVHEGDEVTIERLVGEPEATLVFDDLLHGKKVTAKLIGHDRHDKVHVVKFKSKVRYLRRAGHRQLTSQIRVESIS